MVGKVACSHWTSDAVESTLFTPHWTAQELTAKPSKRCSVLCGTHSQCSENICRQKRNDSVTRRYRGGTYSPQLVRANDVTHGTKLRNSFSLNSVLSVIGWRNWVSEPSNTTGSTPNHAKVNAAVRSAWKCPEWTSPVSCATLTVHSMKFRRLPTSLATPSPITAKLAKQSYRQLHQ